MIEDVKAYFKSIVKEIDKDLKYDGLVFDTDLTADHNLNYTYKLVIGDMKVNRQDTSILSTIPVTLTIYKVSSFDKLEQDFSNTYCKAIDISALSMNQTLISQANYIKGVRSTDIMPAPILSNDNTLKFTLKFVVEVSYNYIRNV